MTTIREKDLPRVTSVTAGDAIALDGATTRSILATDLLANLGVYFPPQGRLTLTSGAPVMTATVAAATTVYFTPSGGNIVPILDAVGWKPRTFAQLSQVTTDATKSPAAAANNSNYDVFVWDDAGTLRATRGPAWSSDTARGTGAGSTELDFTTAFPTNKNAITNGPVANRGTYVGTIRTNGSASVDFIYGALAAGGTAAVFNVWNAYNRVEVATMVRDNTDSWTYNVASTWRAPNGNVTMRVSCVRGLDVDPVVASYDAAVTAGAATSPAAGIGLDSTTAFVGTTATMNANSFLLTISARFAGLMGLGSHFVSALEHNSGSTTASTWYGDAGGAFVQTGLNVKLWA